MSFQLYSFSSVFIISLLPLISGFPSDINEKKCLNYCSNDGVCVIIDENPQCYCLPGWKGNRCDIVRPYNPNEPIKSEPMSRYQLRVHPCDLVPPNMCLNGGLCTFENNTYSCSCGYQYIGGRCEIPSRMLNLSHLSL